MEESAVLIAALILLLSGGAARLAARFYRRDREAVLAVPSLSVMLASVIAVILFRDIDRPRFCPGPMG
jgi:hypothetical protein